MKKSFTIFFLFINSFIVNAQCSVPQNLQTGLLALYTFGNSNTNDSSGNSHNLINTTTAHPATDRNGNIDCAFEFDNIPYLNDEFLSTANTAFLNNLEQFSVSLWYHPLDVNRDGAAFEGLFSRGFIPACPDRVGQWSLGLYDCRRAVFGRHNSVWESFPNPFPASCEELVINNTDSWHHFVATYNQIGEVMKIFKDGVLQETDSGFVDCGSGQVAVQDIGDLFLGKYYTGRLDDVFIFNREISPNEVVQIYTLGSLCCVNNLSSLDIYLIDKIKVSPNPVSNNLFVKMPNSVEISSISIYNALGQLLLSETNPSDNIDISHLKSGNYFIKVITNKGSSTSKFIKE